jgi:glycosyltransferase involved in cell wall biosynthesis
MNKNPKISVVIPTGNSFSKKGGSVRHTLKSLDIQDFELSEVILVSNGNEVEHSNLVNFIKTEIFQFRLKIVRSLGKNRPCSRNIGAKNSSGNDFLMFIDDDTILNGDKVLSSAIELMQNNTADFFLGAKRLWTTPSKWFEMNTEEVLSDISENNFQKIRKYLTQEFAEKERNQNDLEFLKRSFIANFGIIRKRIFETVGMFSEELDLFDDDLLTFYLSRIGRGVASEDISIIHVDHETDNSKFDEYLSLYEQKLSLNNSNDFETLEYINSISI